MPHLLDEIVAIDAAVDRAVDRIRSPALNHVMYGLSSAADHSLVWHATAVIRALRRDGDVQYAARFSGVMGIESALTNGPVKSLFKRVRPVAYDELVFSRGLRRPITSSFPSGHATAAFCAATLLSRGGHRGAWFALAAVVAASRVYVRLHHTSDVAAGAALGCAFGIVFSPVVPK